MVRTYKRKTQIGNTSADLMKEAAISVINRDQSLYQAAQHFGIPKTTLLRYVMKIRKEGTEENVRFCPNYCIRQIFTEQEESLLVEYILTASKLHHGLSSKAARVLAFDYAMANKKQIPSNWILNEQTVSVDAKHLNPMAYCQHSTVPHNEFHCAPPWGTVDRF
jgi:hypothetical protein